MHGTAGTEFDCQHGTAAERILSLFSHARRFPLTTTEMESLPLAEILAYASGY